MLTRREVLLYGALSGGVALPANTFAKYPGDLPTIAATQNELDLDVSIGSLMGAAVGIAAYLFYAQAAPVALLSSFAYILGSQSQVRDIRIATRDYIDYRVGQAENNVIAAQIDVRRDALADAASFRALSSTVTSMSRVLDEIRNSQNQQIREFRRVKENLSREVKDLRREETRSGTSSAIYPEASEQARVTKFDNSREMEAAYRTCTAESLQLQKKIRFLQNQILSG